MNDEVEESTRIKEIKWSCFATELKSIHQIERVSRTQTLDPHLENRQSPRGKQQREAEWRVQKKKKVMSLSF